MSDDKGPVTEKACGSGIEQGNFEFTRAAYRAMENVVEVQQPLQDNPDHNKETTQPSGNTAEPSQVSPQPIEVNTTGIPVPENPELAVSATSPLPDQVKMQIDAEKKMPHNVMSICLTSDGLVIRDEDRGENDEIASRLSGVYCEGVQYYDLNGITYINNTGMAILIDLLKALLEMGVEVQFVNVHESIKKKIRDMGLEKIMNIG